MAIVDTAVHDFDVTRWLLGEELVAIRVLAAKPNSLGGDLQDPLLMILESESGVLVNVETSVNIRYGYDIRGEVVGETGTAALADTRAGRSCAAPTRSGSRCPRTGASASSPPTTWSSRSGSTRWSPGTGPAARAPGTATPPQVVCDAGVKALYSGERVEIDLGDKPALYS